MTPIPEYFLHSEWSQTAIINFVIQCVCVFFFSEETLFGAIKLLKKFRPETLYKWVVEHGWHFKTESDYRIVPYDIVYVKIAKN